MRTVYSEERSTDMVDTRFTAVLLAGEWVAVSQMLTARYEGHDRGFANYTLAVADDAVVAYFYRSNDGHERVTADNGQQWNSFLAAQQWAANETTPTCPHCGRHRPELEGVADTLGDWLGTHDYDADIQDALHSLEDAIAALKEN